MRTLQAIYGKITHFVSLAIHIFDHEIENDNQNQIPIQPIPLQDVQNITERRYPLRDRKKLNFMELINIKTQLLIFNGKYVRLWNRIWNIDNFYFFQFL